MSGARERGAETQTRRLQPPRARAQPASRKGGKEKLVRLHHEAEQRSDDDLEVVAITESAAPLLQTLDKNHRLTGLSLFRRDMLRVVKGRSAAAGLPDTTSVTSKP